MQSGKRGRDQGRKGNVHNPRTRATPVWGGTVAGLDGCPHATDRVTSPRLATACRSCPNYNGPAGFRITHVFLVRAEEQMGRITARGIVAGVQDGQACGNGAVLGKRPRE